MSRSDIVRRSANKAKFMEYAGVTDIPEPLMHVPMDPDTKAHYNALYCYMVRHGVIPDSFLNGLVLMATIMKDIYVWGEQIKDDGGPTCEAKNGEIKRHPLVDQIHKARTQLADLYKQYGQTPMTVSKVAVQPPKEENAFDGL